MSTVGYEKVDRRYGINVAQSYKSTGFTGFVLGNFTFVNFAKSNGESRIGKRSGINFLYLIHQSTLSHLL